MFDDASVAFADVTWWFCIVSSLLDRIAVSVVRGNICNLLLKWCSGNIFSVVIVFWREKEKEMRQSLT